MNNPLSIHQAVQQQNIKLVKQLLVQKNIVNCQDKNTNTPIICAVKTGNIQISQMLIQAGADLNYQNSPHQMSALMYACGKNIPRMCQLLINNGADVNLVNDDRTPPLMIACYLGFTEIVTILLDAGAKVNVQDIDGDTPLCLAIKKNHHEIVTLLINHGADAYFDEGALNLAIDYHNLEMIKTLLKTNIDINIGNRDGVTPLMNASAQGNIEIVRMLIESGANINQQDREGESALHLGCLEGHFQVVQTLLNHHATVDILNQERDTPLIIASLQGHSEIVAQLLNHGANPNYCNNPDTPLSLAIINNWQEITCYLLQAGANPNARLADGKTILMKLCDQNNVDMIRCFLRFGADVNLEDRGGGTALMWAAHRGHLEGVKLLLGVEGININHRNNQGYTAASLAEYNQFHHVCDFIKNHNLD